MITFSYKGWWIHYRMQSRYYGLSEQTCVQGPDYISTTVKSVHAAKCFITRQLKLERT